jgi:hypothetical protein
LGKGWGRVRARVEGVARVRFYIVGGGYWAGGSINGPLGGISPVEGDSARFGWIGAQEPSLPCAWVI